MANLSQDLILGYSFIFWSDIFVLFFFFFHIRTNDISISNFSVSSFFFLFLHYIYYFGLCSTDDFSLLVSYLLIYISIYTPCSLWGTLIYTHMHLCMKSYIFIIISHFHLMCESGYCTRCVVYYRLLKHWMKVF